MRTPAPYLLRRHETYFFRIAIPKHLQPTFQRKEVVKTLETTDIAKARRHARIIANHMELLFDTIPYMTPPTRQQLDTLILSFFQNLKTEQVYLLTLPAETSPAERRELLADMEDDLLKTKEDNLTRGFSSAPTLPVLQPRLLHARTEGERAQRLCEEAHITPPAPNSTDSAYLMAGLREAKVEILRLQMAKIRGDSLNNQIPQGRFQYTHPIASAPTQDTLNTSPTVEAVIEEFIQHKIRSGNWRERAVVQYKPKLNAFLAFLKTQQKRENTPIHTVTFSDLVDFQSYLKVSRPNKAKEGVTFSKESVRKHMSVLGGMLNYALLRRYIVQSPYQSELFKEKVRPGDKENYRSFTQEEMTKLFSSAPFNDRRHFKKTADWWMPILGLFTGARQGELMGLRLEDVAVENDTPYIHVTSNDERDVKNKWSKRKIPIHPTLQELGFLDFVAQQRKNKQKMLLADAYKRASNPQPAYSRKFSRLLDKLEMKDPLLVYHSFRHTFITYARVARINKEDRIAMTGHTPDDVESNYGERPPVWVLAPELAKINFGIDWNSILTPQDRPKPKPRAPRPRSPYRRKRQGV